MKKTRILVIAFAAVALLSGGSWVFASEEIAAETEIACTSCHDKPGSKLLTDKGIYFETQRTLDGFDELSAGFGRCTSCHVKKPGSQKLTADGKKMAALVDNMEELKKWLEENHPEPSEQDDEE